MRFKIPKQDKPVKERVDIKLERSVLATLDEYCRYMESDRDYVIGTVLAVVFRKDKGFVAWRAAQTGAVKPVAAHREERV
jgi:hypothetical protein